MTDKLHPNEHIDKNLTLIHISTLNVDCGVAYVGASPVISSMEDVLRWPVGNLRTLLLGYARQYTTSHEKAVELADRSLLVFLDELPNLADLSPGTIEDAIIERMEIIAAQDGLSPRRGEG